MKQSDDKGIRKQESICNAGQQMQKTRGNYSKTDISTWLAIEFGSCFCRLKGEITSKILKCCFITRYISKENLTTLSVV